jgi:hypothetical protein
MLMWVYHDEEYEIAKIDFGEIKWPKKSQRWDLTLDSDPMRFDWDSDVSD